MTRVLFLDDADWRHNIVLRKLPFAKAVYTAADCITALEEPEPWDFVLLDHDLGNDIYVDSARDDTGMGVVRWILKNKPVIGKIICHSLNAPARQNMYLQLRDAGYDVDPVPFCSFDAIGLLEEIRDHNG